MTSEEKARAAKAMGLRAKAETLCLRSNRLQKQADRLYERADALSSQATAVAEKADGLFAQANGLCGHMLRRKCLKCNCSFGSASSSHRICTDCNAENAGIKNEPGRPPRWNGNPMVMKREEDGLL